MMASDTAQIYFDDVRVPQRYRIGEEGMGFTYQMQQFQEERLWAASNLLQALQSCIDETVAYARDRKLFGSTVLDAAVGALHAGRAADRAGGVARMTYRAVRAIRGRGRM